MLGFGKKKNKDAAKEGDKAKGTAAPKSPKGKGVQKDRSEERRVGKECRL